jgi:hypothetical protein
VLCELFWFLLNCMLRAAPRKATHAVGGDGPPTQRLEAADHRQIL